MDREGERTYDYHTAGKGGYLKAQVKTWIPKKGDIEDTNVIVTKRWYLADSVFLAGLESENAELLAKLQHAVESPRWPLFLGRKAYLPSSTVWLPDGLKLGAGLRLALESYPWLINGSEHRRPRFLRLILEANQHGERWVRDIPLSFEHGRRDFTLRRVTFDECAVPQMSVEAP